MKNAGDFYKSIRFGRGFPNVTSHREKLKRDRQDIRDRINQPGHQITEADQFYWSRAISALDKEDSRDASYEAAVLKAKESHKQFLGYFLAPTQNVQPGRLLGPLLTALFGVIVQPFSYIVYLRKVRQAYEKHYQYPDGLTSTSPLLSPTGGGQPGGNPPTLAQTPTPQGPAAGSGTITIGPNNPLSPRPANAANGNPSVPPSTSAIVQPTITQQPQPTATANGARSGATTAGLISVMPAIPTCNKTGSIAATRPAGSNSSVPSIWMAIDPVQHHAKAKPKSRGGKGKTGHRPPRTGRRSPSGHNKTLG